MRSTRTRFSDGSGGTNREPRLRVSRAALMAAVVAGMFIAVVATSAVIDRIDRSQTAATIAAPPAAAPHTSTLPSAPPGPSRASEPTSGRPTAGGVTQGDAADGGHDHTDAASDAAIEAAGSATVTFIDAWLLRGSPTERQEVLAPLATPALVNALASVDLSSLPDAQRVSQPILVASGTYQTVFHVELSDGSVVEVSMVDDGEQGWTATDIQPADEL